MRNLQLVDAVIQLHDIARLVEAEVGEGELSQDIRNIADRLHQYSIQDDKANTIAQSIIQQVKE
jgi:cation transport regulator ChaC